MRSFYQDRLRTNIGKALKREMRSLLRSVTPPQPASAVRKTALLRHLYHIKTNILPRQARDKHRENSKKDRFSSVNMVLERTPGANGATFISTGGEAFNTPFLR
jgi:hypothetical protein